MMADTARSKRAPKAETRKVVNLFDAEENRRGFVRDLARMKSAQRRLLWRDRIIAALLGAALVGVIAWVA